MAEINAECSMEEEFEMGLEGVVKCTKVKTNRKGILGILILFVFLTLP